MARSAKRIVALITDFGSRDWYVGVLKGVLLSRCSTATIVDITHDVPPQDVTHGAFALAAAAPWFPTGTVCVAIVDPGVGTGRRLLAAEGNGRYFIGPDNGLLALALGQCKRPRMVQLTNRQPWLPRVSGTFHGRDIVAPVAAYLANGGSLGSLGARVAQIHPCAVPPVQRRGDRVEGRVTYIDGFGNLLTNVPGDRLGTHTAVVHFRGRRARMVSSYAGGRPNELVAIVGSMGFVELAARKRSAARMTRGKRGDPVVLRVLRGAG